jgi:hypothetical protein
MRKDEVVLWSPIVWGRTFLVKPVTRPMPKRGPFHRFQQRHSEYDVGPTTKRKPEPKRTCARWSEAGKHCGETQEGQKGVKRGTWIRKNSTCNGYGQHGQQKRRQRELPLSFHFCSRGKSTDAGWMPITAAITQRKRRRETHHHYNRTRNGAKIPQPPFPLGVSRPGSLGFRIRFVFPVVHPFPLVASQYLIHVQWTPGPSQNRGVRPLRTRLPPSTCGLDARCVDAGKPPQARHCVRRASRSPRVLAWMPSLHRGAPSGSPGFDPLDWPSSFNGTMHPSDSLLSFASLACKACRAYSDGHDWAS